MIVKIHVYLSLMPNSPARVLEIGCAEGVFSVHLANAGFNDIGSK
jgi:2-polyprenyl-3-methyl-5-hydroxy-6-metoxy-1,4-benzoquinol methylase